MSDNPKLDKVIDIGGQNYEVQAKSAEKVEHKLVVKQVGLGGTTLDTPLVEFDGSVAEGETEKFFEIIPAKGGKFKGPLRVPAADVANVDGYKNINGGQVHNDAVLNYGDIKNKILNQLLNNSVLYTWDNSQLNPTTKSSFNGISIVSGLESHLENLVEATINNKPSCYLYICTDTSNIYFGKDTNVPLKLSNSSEILVSTTDGTDYTADDLTERLNTIDTDLAASKSTSQNLSDNLGGFIHGHVGHTDSVHGKLNRTVTDIEEKLAGILDHNNDTYVQKARTADEATVAKNVKYGNTPIELGRCFYRVSDKNREDTKSELGTYNYISMGTNTPNNDVGHTGDIYIQYSAT